MPSPLRAPFAGESQRVSRVCSGGPKAGAPESPPPFDEGPGRADGPKRVLFLPGWAEVSSVLLRLVRCQRAARLAMAARFSLISLQRCILSSVKAAWDGEQEAKETLELVRRLCMLFALVRLGAPLPW